MGSHQVLTNPLIDAAPGEGVPRRAHAPGPSRESTSSLQEKDAMSFFRSCLAVLLAASVLASCSPAASSGSAPGRAEARSGGGGPSAARPLADNYFAGKTLTILVNL